MTAVNTPLFTGSAAPFSRIKLYATPVGTTGMIEIGQTTADSSGNWQLTSNVLPDGGYNIAAQATDPAGKPAGKDAVTAVAA